MPHYVSVQLAAMLRLDHHIHLNLSQLVHDLRPFWVAGLCYSGPSNLLVKVLDALHRHTGLNVDMAVVLE